MQSGHLNAVVPAAVPSLRELFTAWFAFGIQSFGGGSPTFYLMNRACVGRGWLRDDEFVHTWALAQVSPGINLVKMTVLIGYKLRGWPGIAATMLGMLLPSAAVTVLMTVGFAVVRHAPMVQAAMRGILPATIGLSFAAAARMGQPLLRQGRQQGPVQLAGHVLVIITALLLMATGHVSPVLILVTAGLANIVLFRAVPEKSTASPRRGAP